MKKVVTPSHRREMTHKAVAEKTISIRLACCTFGISETYFHYQARLSAENAVIAHCLLRLTQCQRNWGFRLCFLYLRNANIVDLSGHGCAGHGHLLNAF